MPLGTHLKGLHDAIQAAMGWQDYHLFEFRIGDKHYGMPEIDEEREIQQAKSIKLATLTARGIERFDYVYDFGDDWEHTIAIEAIFDADPAVKYPRFVDGKRRGPPEDVGGPPGFFDFIEAMANPKHPEHRHLSGWYGGPYDPDDIDLLNTRLRLDALAKRRHAGKIAHLNSRPKR